MLVFTYLYVQMLTRDRREAAEEGIPVDYQHGDLVRKVHCRVTQFEPILSLKHLKANFYGEYIVVVDRSYSCRENFVKIMVPAVI